MIKFRGKDNHTGEWHYGNYIVLPGRFGPQPSIYVAPDDLITPVSECLYDVDARTVGAYTRLKDENGKDIYEGDILEVGGFHAQTMWHHKEPVIRVVHWREKGACLDLLWEGALESDRKVGLNFDNGSRGKMEIIGNIHDNYEILNVPQKGGE